MGTLFRNNCYFMFKKNKLIDNFNNYSKLGNIYYPLKTNHNVKILNVLNNLFDRSVNGFLISNIYHYQLLKSLNIDPKQMCLINVLSNIDTIKYLYAEGIRFFVFDNIELLKEFSTFANLSECKISIRLNTMEVFEDVLMHLGANTTECCNMIHYLKDKCKNIGISFYLQTKIKNELNALEKMLNHIEQNFNNFNISFISIAGIKKYDEINESTLNKIKISLNLNEIILEPGKYLVGDTIDMLTKVIRLKEVKNKLILIIKNGIYSGFLDVILYNENFKLYFKTKDNKYVEFCHKKDNNHDYEIYMCGGSSDSGDVIGKVYINKVYKDEFKVGMDILVKDVGAYFEEFFMLYGSDINKVYVEVDD